jgi:hypothetical protein
MRREVWKKIPGYPWYYEVSNKGRMRSLERIDKRGWKRRTKILKISDAQITLNGKWCSLARLILLAFVGPPPKGCYLARHLNDDRENNNLENLAWGTDQDNHDDAVKNGVSYISYGHLGKPHTKETKELLSKQRKGIPTNRRMTIAHKKAIWAGYRKKFPGAQTPW